MEKEKLYEKLKELTKKEVSLTYLHEVLGLNEYEIVNLVKLLKEDGYNITLRRLDDDVYLFSQGEVEMKDDNSFHVNTDENHEFKFVAISDTRFGSKYQQLSLLNDIYMKAYEMGYTNVILCGNISEGIYPATNCYADTNFLDDTLRQVDYIIENYPYIEGMHTYFITGVKDDKHIKNNKINIGKRIEAARDDMTYLGNASCLLTIDKVKMLVFSGKLGKTYTVSYRPQQQIDSFRSEDKPDVLLYGGLCQMEKFNYRNVQCISVPSVVATTREMSDRRYSNTVGAWYIDLRTNSKGLLEHIDAMDSVYYVTNKDDYTRNKVLKIGSKEGKQK